MSWLQLFGSEYRTIFQDAFAFAVIIMAFIWGGGPERAVAVTWVVVIEIGGRVHSAFFRDSIQLTDVDVFLASSDFILGASFITIALYANRNYTLWIAGMQVLAMSAHVARALSESILPIGYAVMVVAPGWFQLFLLAIGITRHALRKRKFGDYRDWRITKTVSNFQSPASKPNPLGAAIGAAGPSWRDRLK